MRGLKLKDVHVKGIKNGVFTAQFTFKLEKRHQVKAYFS